MNSMGGTSRTGTHMSAVDCKYLSFTGVGYTDLAYVNLGATRSGAKGAGADIEAGQTDRNGQRRADASIHLPPIPGPARMPLMGEGETMQGLMSALEQRRLDASLTRGQGLPGSVWQTLAQDFVILPHLLDNPEHPRDDLLPLYAKLFLAALGIPIRSASATNKIQGVLMLYLPYNTADGDLVEQAAAAIKYLEPSIDSALSIFLSRASELLAALSYRRTRAMGLLHAARLLAPADVLALDGNGLVSCHPGALGPAFELSECHALVLFSCSVRAMLQAPFIQERDLQTRGPTQMGMDGQLRRWRAAPRKADLCESLSRSAADRMANQRQPWMQRAVRRPFWACSCPSLPLPWALRRVRDQGQRGQSTQAWSRGKGAEL